MFTTHDLDLFVLIGTFLSCFQPHCGMEKHRRFFGRSGDIIFLPPENWQSEGIADVRWKYNDTLVCTHRDGVAACKEGYGVFANGTLRLNASERRGGTYSLEMYDKDGKSIQNPGITLTILEPISGTEVTQTCMMNGWVMLTCSVTSGDSVTFRWMLNTTSDNNIVSEEQTVYFYNLPPENLVCEVENAVSRQNILVVALTCRDYIFIIIPLGAFIFTTLFCVALWSIRKELVKKVEDVEEDVYITMHSCQEAKKQTEADDISQYDACTLQPIRASCSEKTADAEDIYI